MLTLPKPVSRFGRLRKGIRKGVVRACHPNGATCLECGFLSFGTEELIKNDRLLLSVEGAAGLPDDAHLSHICCFKSLWVPLPTDTDEIFTEIKKVRRPCEGFLRYRPGYSPLDHRGLSEKKQERREKMLIGILSALGGMALTLFTAWLRRHFGF